VRSELGLCRASITAARRSGSTRAHVTVGIGPPGVDDHCHITVSDVTVKAPIEARRSPCQSSTAKRSYSASTPLSFCLRAPRNGSLNRRKVAHHLRHEDLIRPASAMMRAAT